MKTRKLSNSCLNERRSQHEAWNICVIPRIHRHNEGGTMPWAPDYWVRRKVLTISQVHSFIQHIHSQKTLGSNIGATNLFL